ncbi:hypothetical protein AB205_0110130 [Aquarana catesbeiana]|uniref:C-type lectin domain-containing protein n=1 Tax=Aquarana catesbeiana TaxID=8400 RepID=A0A2G9RBV1_AQUCT|nr:hypothetical protein AB205_0110130 [Aquarana catesbeiana]
MESDQSTFHDFQNSGNRWSNYYRQNPERLSYGLLALLYIMILALFITVFSKSSSSGNLQLVSKKEINDFNSKDKKCQDDWIQFENSCYYISKTKFDWTEARTMCQKKESDLLVINSAKEQLFIAGKTNPTSFKRFWLGLHDTDEEGLWKWVDETNYETSYKSWTKGEPNNHGDEEDCALLWTNGEWNDVPCSYENSYAVCEQKL